MDSPIRRLSLEERFYIQSTPLSMGDTYLLQQPMSQPGCRIVEQLRNEPKTRRFSYDESNRYLVRQPMYLSEMGFPYQQSQTLQHNSLGSPYTSQSGLNDTPMSSRWRKISSEDAVFIDQDQTMAPCAMQQHISVSQYQQQMQQQAQAQMQQQVSMSQYQPQMQHQVSASQYQPQIQQSYQPVYQTPQLQGYYPYQYPQQGESYILDNNGMPQMAAARRPIQPVQPYIQVQTTPNHIQTGYMSAVQLVTSPSQQQQQLQHQQQSPQQQLQEMSMQYNSPSSAANTYTQMANNQNMPIVTGSNHQSMQQFSYTMAQMPMTPTITPAMTPQMAPVTQVALGPQQVQLVHPVQQMQQGSSQYTNTPMAFYSGNTSCMVPTSTGQYFSIQPTSQEPSPTAATVIQSSNWTSQIDEEYEPLKTSKSASNILITKRDDLRDLSLEDKRKSSFNLEEHLHKHELQNTGEFRKHRSNTLDSMESISVPGSPMSSCHKSNLKHQDNQSLSKPLRKVSFSMDHTVGTNFSHQGQGKMDTSLKEEPNSEQTAEELEPYVRIRRLPRQEAQAVMNAVANSAKPAIKHQEINNNEKSEENETELEPYVGLRRMPRSKTVDSGNDGGESVAKNDAILRRKSTGSQKQLERTRKISFCPMTAYKIRGSSTVAIDNKIEQAMDLVKSHLMFAVREEVDVLKEQIRDLVERMSQLEYENGILRAAATPETLALLAQPRQPPAPSSS